MARMIALFLGCAASITGATADQQSTNSTATTKGATILISPQTSDLKPIAVDDNFEYKCCCLGDDSAEPLPLDIIDNEEIIPECRLPVSDCPTTSIEAYHPNFGEVLLEVDTSEAKAGAIIQVDLTFGKDQIIDADAAADGISADQVAPSNDMCTNAIELTTGTTVSGSTTDATFDGVGTCGSSNTAPGVWYSFVPTEQVLASVSTCGFFDYDTKISVFSGTCGSLSCVDGNDDYCGLLSRVDFIADAGVRYFVLVHGFSSSKGNFELTLSTLPARIVLGSDECQSAVALSAGSVYGTTNGATFDDVGHCGTRNTSPGVWYSYEPTESVEVVTLSTCDFASYNTKISVFTGSCSELTCIAGNDNACGSRSRVTFVADAGVKYFILVHGSGSRTGTYSLTLSSTTGGLGPRCDPYPFYCDVVNGATDGTYLYDVVVGPGGDIFQYGGFEALVGDYERSHDDVMYYGGGDFCGPIGDNRSGSVRIIEGNVMEPTMTAFEVSTCVYDFIYTVPSCSSEPEASIVPNYWVPQLDKPGLTCDHVRIKIPDHGEYTCLSTGEAICRDNGGTMGKWLFGVDEIEMPKCISDSCIIQNGINTFPTLIDPATDKYPVTGTTYTDSVTGEVCKNPSGEAIRGCK